MFSLNYDGVNTTLVSMNSLTSEALQEALNNLTTVREQGKVNVTELIKNKNSSSYRVTFYFKNPEKTRMLVYNSEASDMVSLKITRLQKGKMQTELSYTEPLGVLFSTFLLRGSHKPKIPWLYLLRSYQWRLSLAATSPSFVFANLALFNALYASSCSIQHVPAESARSAEEISKALKLSTL